MELSIADFVRSETSDDFTSLVSLLARSYEEMQYSDHFVSNELRDLTAQAKNLRDTFNWREAAEAAGWSRDVDADDDECFMNIHGVHEYSYADSWMGLCLNETIGVEPLSAQEIIVVSNELAQRLISAGEQVDTGFSGFVLWAKTTAGPVEDNRHIQEFASAWLEQGGYWPQPETSTGPSYN